MLSAILILLILPFVDSSAVKSPRIRPFFNLVFIIFVFNFLLLGFLGGCPAEEPYITLSRVASFIYFSYFLLFIPLISNIENNNARVQAETSDTIENFTFSEYSLEGLFGPLKSKKIKLYIRRH